jgi:thiol-disulfide isomerase/thioredoxin
MKRAIFVTLLLSLLLATPAWLKAAEQDPFAADYQALSRALEAKMAEVKSRSDFDKLQAERQSALQALLAKYAAAPETEPFELLRARILIDMKKYADAEAKLNSLAARNPRLGEARLLLARIFSETEKVAAAIPLFKEVEAKLERSADFFAVALALALEAPDDAVRHEYCKKLLAAGDLPKPLAGYRVYLFTTLAEIEARRGDLAAAKGILQEGLKQFSGSREEKSLQSAMKQLDFIGKPAPAISAQKWLNSPPLSLEALKGKVVVIDFWAPWCPPCRQVIPTLVRDFNELKGRGLVVIGFTKLYGSYRDEQQNKGKVGADEERALIQGFVERWKMAYPVAISDQGEDFDDYGISGIPTMVFIDKSGKVSEIKVGSGNEAAMTEKIKKLLTGK